MKPDDFPKNAKDFFSYAKKNQAEMVDLKFVDMLGSWQHCSFPRTCWMKAPSRRALGSTARRFAAGWASTSPT